MKLDSLLMKTLQQIEQEIKDLKDDFNKKLESLEEEKAYCPEFKNKFFENHQFFNYILDNISYFREKIENEEYKQITCEYIFILSNKKYKFYFYKSYTDGYYEMYYSSIIDDKENFIRDFEPFDFDLFSVTDIEEEFKDKNAELVCCLIYSIIN